MSEVPVAWNGSDEVSPPELRTVMLPRGWVGFFALPDPLPPLVEHAAIASNAAMLVARTTGVLLVAISMAHHAFRAEVDRAANLSGVGTTRTTLCEPNLHRRGHTTAARQLPT